MRDDGGASGEAIAQALESVATDLGPPAEETILLENRGKHVHEIRWLLARPRSSVIDIGGGLGVNLLSVRRLVGPGPRLVLLDRLREYDDTNRMGSAERALPLLEAEGVEVDRTDFWPEPRLGHPDGSFEAATVFDVLEHLPGSPLPLLIEIRRVLDRDGRLYLGGPNAAALMRRAKLAAGRHPYMPYDLWVGDEEYVGHFREYTPSEYRGLLVRAGFQPGRVELVAEPTRTRARRSYHRGRHHPLSPRALALRTANLVESALPPLRPSVYCEATPAEEADVR
ncbi:MAG: methyltransferase domain-containing protein [Gemmatimonadota bacterium]|jgi:SAM-dependent methyltransferase